MGRKVGKLNCRKCGEEGHFSKDCLSGKTHKGAVSQFIDNLVHEPNGVGIPGKGFVQTGSVIKTIERKERLPKNYTIHGTPEWEYYLVVSFYVDRSDDLDGIIADVCFLEKEEEVYINPADDRGMIGNIDLECEWRDWEVVGHRNELNILFLNPEMASENKRKGRCEAGKGERKCFCHGFIALKENKTMCFCEHSIERHEK